MLQAITYMNSYTNECIKPTSNRFYGHLWKHKDRI